MRGGTVVQLLRPAGSFGEQIYHTSQRGMGSVIAPRHRKKPGQRPGSPVVTGPGPNGRAVQSSRGSAPSRFTDSLSPQQAEHDGQQDAVFREFGGGVADSTSRAVPNRWHTRSATRIQPRTICSKATTGQYPAAHVDGRPRPVPASLQGTHRFQRPKLS